MGHSSRVVGYELRQRLGRGGMSVVDLARDPAGRPVALKRVVLHGSAFGLAQARQRVHREAEALARLDHPAVVPLLDVIDDGDEIVLVMPYLAGGGLADHVRTRGPLSPGQVEHLADTLLAGLAAAHREGIVHRDIKPANVLFDREGRAHLADFGVASIRDATSGLTATGSPIGTPEFMAPEQARGEPATPASDVFSLGATLLYAATGQPPYGRCDPRVALQRAAQGRLAPLPRELNGSLRRRLAPMLHRNPRRRPSAAAAAGGPAGTIVAARGPSRRSAALLPAIGAGTLAAVACLGAIAAGVWYLRSHRVAFAGPDATASPAASIPSSPCTPKPYQPCGAPAAPNTDGSRCLGEHADYDADATNGCEAGPDTVDGQPLTSSLSANLVPGADVDRYPVPVQDRFQLFCDGTFQVTLAGPAGAAARLELYDGSELLGGKVSRDGSPVTVSVPEPNCLTDDSTELTAQVSWDGDARSAAPYRLTRTGSF
ncbi:serine/threonine-protein kinase [Rhabdothermincola sediminis]|uniref:serine/threonine-protein kinase n=1 Tax=Rhabdothermincola sediminis TaxID=2751370 RepID=UPI0027DA88E6|nr:serine/threonine-protein kinase [Rhabdothermincola sediminis]